MLFNLLLVKCYLENRSLFFRPVYIEQDNDNSVESEDDNKVNVDTYTVGRGNPSNEFGFSNNLNQSISRAKLRTSPNNLKGVLNQEFNDVSAELGNKLTGQIENLQTDGHIDREKYKQIFVIGKHIVSDGKRRIVKINVKEQIVPKDVSPEDIKIDNGTRALLGCILFLLAGLVFTTTIKMYQGFVKKEFNRNNTGITSDIPK